MRDSAAAFEKLYLSYEAELASVQAHIDRCQREATEYRDRYTALLNDRAEAIKALLSREVGQ